MFRPRAIFFAFVLCQLLDGGFTYLGTSVRGLMVELNPVVSWYMGLLGAGPALVAAKLVSIGCAMVLHFSGWHRTLLTLVALHICVAIVPALLILMR